MRKVRAGVNKVAVENFLASMDKTLSKRENIWNLCSDARAYNWGAQTFDYIANAIEKHYATI